MHAHANRQFELLDSTSCLLSTAMSTPPHAKPVGHDDLFFPCSPSLLRTLHPSLAHSELWLAI
jgi:hypothetical protein